LKEDKVADLPNTAEAKHPEKKKNASRREFSMDEKKKRSDLRNVPEHDRNKDT